MDVMELALRAGRRLPLSLLFFIIFYDFLCFFRFMHLIEFKAFIPGSDVSFYWYLGKLINDYGLILKQFESYFFSPVYAFLFYIFGVVYHSSVSVASLFSFFSFLLCGFFLYKVTYMIFKDRDAAFVSVVIFFSCRIFIFYAVLPLKTMFFLLLLMVFTFLYMKSIESSSALYSFLAGIVSSVAFNVEGLFLPIFLLLTVFCVFRKRVRVLSFLILGFLIGLTPLLIRNYVVKKHVSFLSPVSGIHFYIGNNENANGIYKKISGIRPNAFGHYFDAKKYAERELKRNLDDSAVNSFWKRKAFTFIFNNFPAFINLYFKKLMLTMNNFEVPNNFNIYSISERSSLLRFNPIGFSAVFVLSIGGIFLHFLADKRIDDFAFLALIFPFVLAAFFITSRYRVIWLLMLVPYAGYFISNFRELLKKRKIKFTLLLFSVLAFALFFSNITLLGNFEVNCKKVYLKRLYLAEKIAKLEERLQKSESFEERKDILLEEARLFYLSKMKEVGNFLRKKAYSR